MCLFVKISAGQRDSTSQCGHPPQPLTNIYMKGSIHLLPIWLVPASLQMPAAADAPGRMPCHAIGGIQLHNLEYVNLHFFSSTNQRDASNQCMPRSRELKLFSGIIEVANERPGFLVK